MGGSCRVCLEHFSYSWSSDKGVLKVGGDLFDKFRASEEWQGMMYEYPKIHLSRWR